MVVANFGMGYRPTSAVVKTDQERESEYQAQQANLLRRQGRLTSSLQARATDFARQNIENTMALGYDLSPEVQANLLKELAPAYLGSNLSVSGMGPPVPHTTNAPSPWSAQLRENGELNRVTAQLKAAPFEFGAQNEAIASSQASQQAAYTNANGGAIGGVLPGVARSGIMDPTQPTASMPWGQPWSTPGFGNPGSLGGLGGYKPSGPQGWGSVFGGGRNPWSLA